AFSSGSCPHDVKGTAHECFTAYSFQLTNMVNSANKLCCGMDVETLRAFCDSYRMAVSCIHHLRSTCHRARHLDIESASVHFEDTRHVLHELCSDDSLFENYAMHQTCLTKAGPVSEQCFNTHLGHLVHSNQSFRFLTKISNHRRKEQVCVDMYNTITCVKRNINNTCGHHAARLAITLVKPMVSVGTECNYTVIESQQKQTTKKPHHSHNALISDKHTSSSKGKGNRDADNAENKTNSYRPSVSLVATLILTASLHRLLPL
ncbi:hypothetical protein Bpfe_007333, partial [Biomphalaria pfeifferi]